MLERWNAKAGYSQDPAVGVWGGMHIARVFSLSFMISRSLKSSKEEFLGWRQASGNFSRIFPFFQKISAKHVCALRDFSKDRGPRWTMCLVILSEQESRTWLWLESRVCRCEVFTSDRWARNSWLGSSVLLVTVCLLSWLFSFAYLKAIITYSRDVS